MHTRSYLLYILLSLVLAFIYAAFPSRMHFTDGLYYAYHLEKFPISQSWHPHHLLWLPLMHVIFDLIRAVFPDYRAMAFLQLSNAILGGLCIFLFILLVCKITRNNNAGIMSGLLLGSSWGMMHYSADANIYTLVLVFTFLTLLIIVSGYPLTLKRAVFATIMMTLVTSLHQMGFFFAFVVLTGIIVRSQRSSRLRNAIICAFIYSVLTVIMYYGVYLLIRDQLFGEVGTGFFNWLTVYGQRREFWTMFSRGFLLAQEIFVRAQLNLFLHIQDTIKAFSEQGYRETYNTLVLYVIFHMIILLSVLFEVKNHIIFNYNKQDLQLRSIRQMLILWFMLYFIFNQFYCAFEIHYKLFYLPPLLLIWTLQILESSPRERKIWNVLTVAILAGMFIWNTTTGVIPNSHPENNPFLKDVLALKQIVTDDDLVIYARHERYLSALTRVYTSADSVFFQTEFRYSSGEKNFDEINKITIEYLKQRYKRIILSDNAFKSGYNKWFFSGHLLPPPHPEFIAFNRRWMYEISQIKTEDGKIYHEMGFLSELTIQETILSTNQ